MIQEGIRQAVEQKNLSAEASYTIMNEMMIGQTTPSQIASFITAMRMKGETEDEIRGFVKAMREHASKISAPEDSVDLCGTGGDGLNTFNIGTAASFVVAGAGVPVAKHGNRSASSLSGSADVLSALGIPFDLDPAAVEACLKDTGIGFMFAPLFHKSMKNVQSPRKEVGIRTFFNILGPMANPAGVRNQLIGVYDPALSPIIARVLRDLGSRRAMVVNGDGMDEVTTLGRTKVVELLDGAIREYEISPEKFGLDFAEPGEIAGGTATENARTMLSILKGEDSPRTDIVTLNAAAALYVSGRALNIEEGLEMAVAAIRSGNAKAKLEEFSRATRELERERQLAQDISILRTRMIVPEVLVRRCSEIAGDLCSEVSRLDGAADIMRDLDQDLLLKPSVLSVLVLSRIRSVLLDTSKSTMVAKRSGLKLSETISSSGSISIIGEYKPRSPSSPPLLVPPDIGTVAQVFAGSGLAGASVLVEPDFFGGSVELFSTFRSKLSLPLLFKDFAVTERQIDLAHNHGADAILLIAKALSSDSLDRLIRRSLALGLEPLVELHDSSDLEKFSSCSCSDSLELVGLNSRNLKTLELDLEQMRELRKALGSDRMVIAESGVKSPLDVKTLEGFDAVLVGSLFMGAEDLKRTVEATVETGRSVPR
jgi:anthranilate phosphoribosyltransferase